MLRSKILHLMLGLLFLLSGANAQVLRHIMSVTDTTDGPPGYLYQLSDVAVSPNGDFFVTDEGYYRVVKFDKNGNYLLQWDLGGNLALHPPVNGRVSGMAYYYSMDVDKKGNVYIASKFYYEISKYSSTGELLNSFGTDVPDSVPRFYSPTGLCVDDSYNIYFVDNGNYPVLYKFDSAGTYVNHFRIDSAFQIYNMALDLKGNAYFLDDQYVYKYDLNTGKFLAKWGGYGFENNNLLDPEGIAVAPDGNIWVTELYNYRIKKFSPEGKHLENFYGASESLNGPAAICFAGNLAYIADNTIGDKVGYNEIKIYQVVPKLNPTIVGKTKVPVNVKEKYRIFPDIPGAEYEWNFTGDSLFTLFASDSRFGSTSNSEMSIVAVEGTDPGFLYCKIYIDGQYYDSVARFIEPVVAPEVYALKPPVCTLNTSKCDGSFISYFNFHTLINSTGNCDATGYADFTADTLTAEIRPGELYNARLKVAATSASDPQYVAIWIDFNNDGDFTDPGEFAGSSVALNGEANIINIRVPENNYYGQARLRARIRPVRPFSDTESCLRTGDEGETEDYTVKIVGPSALQAPDAITPNNDGKNDYFVIKGMDEIAGNTLLITDALGNVILEKNNYTNDWPQQNSSLKKGTYFYHFTNGSNSLKGFFVLNY